MLNKNKRKTSRHDRLTNTQINRVSGEQRGENRERYLNRKKGMQPERERERLVDGQTDNHTDAYTERDGQTEADRNKQTNEDRLTVHTQTDLEPSSAFS